MSETRGLNTLGPIHMVARTNRADAAVERALARSVTTARARACLAEEVARLRVAVVEGVALDALQAGTQVARHGAALATVCPAAEPMLRAITEQAGLALGQVVSDTARALR